MRIAKDGRVMGSYLDLVDMRSIRSEATCLHPQHLHDSSSRSDSRRYTVWANHVVESASDITASPYPPLLTFMQTSDQRSYQLAASSRELVDTISSRGSTSIRLSRHLVCLTEFLYIALRHAIVYHVHIMMFEICGLKPV